MDSSHAKEGLLNGLRCPRCGSSDVRPSKRDGVIDALWAMFSRSPLRCRSCRRRFYIRADSTHPAEHH